ncbi:MAG: hypothetical protein QM755_11200 [Luteolibacter sp.]
MKTDGTISRWIALHLAILLVGAGLAMIWTRWHRPSESVVEENSTMPTAGADDLSKRKKAIRRREDFRQTWTTLEEDQSAEAVLARDHLLGEWAESDLDGALAAAATRERRAILGNSRGMSFQGFREQMKREPERFWPAIRDGRFGLVTASLREFWVEQLKQSHPALLQDYLQQMGPLARARFGGAQVPAH